MQGTSRGLVRFGLSRVVVLFLVLLLAPYLTISIMNLGGELDNMRKAQIRFEVAQRIYTDPDLQGLPPEELGQMVDELSELKYRELGLDQPLIRRNFNHMWRAISLNLGQSESMVSDIGSRSAPIILAERLEPTFLLFGIAMLALFAMSVPVGLLLSVVSRRRGRFLDRLVIRLAPISAAPVWFYGLLLALVFAAHGGGLPWGRAVGAILLGSVFASIYSWRTFFLGHSNDEQNEPAGAGESSAGVVDRGSFVRPTPPRIIIHFLILAAGVLMASIILEVVLNWPGVGQLLYQAMMLNDTPVILGALVIYGYVLAFLVVMVFLLDFLDVWLIQRRGLAEAQGGK